LLNQLKEHGIKICIDDFGIGYSAMKYLQNIPVDKSFVDNIHHDTGSAS